MDELSRKKRIASATPDPRQIQQMPKPSAPPSIFGQGVQREMAEPQREIVGVHQGSSTRDAAGRKAIDSEKLRKISEELNKYKSGKASVDRRVTDAERWWKMRNDFMVAMATDGEWAGNGNERAPLSGFTAKTGWMHNVINSKHADALEAYPTPSILPREEGDKVEAWALSKIIPVILKQNGFEGTYDKAMWQKLKTGTGVYQIVWDREKLNGLGDISINNINLLNVFWEPGVNDIQDSKYLFHTALEDKDELVSRYPELLTGKPLQTVFEPKQMPHDDARDKSNKAIVVDCYYKKWAGGKKLVHYLKFVGDTVLYSSEDDPELVGRGMYDHGKYPFVFDALFPIEDSPAGYGYVDICANAQTRIDLLNTANLKNTLVGAMPRYFSRTDGAINEEEFLDLNNPIIHVNGNLGDDSVKSVDYKPLSGNYINVMNFTVDELRETSGNTETSTGSSTHGVTAAAAFAALQEASGKTSRASTIASYRAYNDIIYMVIELIRQFYTMPRQFRITGNMGVQKYITFTNAGMQPQPQGTIGGLDMGVRTPIYDIKVVPEKQNSYTRLSQNELAIQLYQLGIFNPQNVDQALACVSMMDFDGKDELQQQLSMNGTLFQQMQQYQLMAAMLARKYEPQLVGGLLGAGQQRDPERKGGGQRPELDKGNAEASHVTKAREKAAAVGQPGGAGA